MALLRWMSRWPLGALHALGAGLGWLTWLASPSYRRRVRANADLAGVSAADRRRSVSEAGRMVGEVPWLWLMPPEGQVLPRVRWQGAEKVDAAIAAGRGLVLLTPHLGSFEVSARAIVERWGAQQPLTVLYRPARNAFLRELEETARHRPGLATAPANLSGVRQMLRALKKGEMVGLLPDQVPPEGQGVWAPFFGQPAYTMTLAARLVQQTGAAVLVLCCERLPGAAGFEVHLLDLVGPLPAGSDEAAQVQAARIVNRTMEMVIARWPHQYLWGYHRYKRPRAAPGTPG
ncbi:lysophospholipid acyltransferase family protein [Ideonella sp. 4Y16]|uniref:lysophospholipid acyltransferase family protein n=1 Tax=Ideonella alba TaxID=2824118 RepID=UPI001B387878|nr:lysophospholipid acyltransferase family protein [Ideonella alba]MBQ0945413.1 lysophospholipid acyltransferase family protein [Ideonella alba]